MGCSDSPSSYFHCTVYGLENAFVCLIFNGWYDDPDCENLIITGYDLRKHHYNTLPPPPLLILYIMGKSTVALTSICSYCVIFTDLAGFYVTDIGNF